MGGNKINKLTQNIIIDSNNNNFK